MSVLNRPTLVLNKGWAPVDIMSVKDALSKVFTDGARLIDTDDFSMHDWESWLNFSVTGNMPYIATTSLKVRLLPESTLIIIATRYTEVPSCEVKLTRANLLTRDRHCCAYTGKRLRLHNATIDHIMPRSRGGRHNWHNVVIASVEANRRKGRKTLEEAGMRLRCRPFKPTWSPLFSACVGKVPEPWKHFINPDKIFE